MVMLSTSAVGGQDQSRAETPRVFVPALCSGAIAVPVWFLLALAGIFTGAFFFLPWSANLGHILFMVSAGVVGVVVAALYWRISPQNVALLPHHHGDAEEPVMGCSNDHCRQQLHRLLSRESHLCCFHISRFSIQGCDVLLALEFLILGILVLLSPHVMVAGGDGSSLLTPDDKAPAAEVYPVEIAWKMCLLHFWFLFATNVSFLLGFGVGLVHFAVLMAHYQRLELMTILLSLVWLLTPLLCAVVVAVRRKWRLRWRRCGAPVVWPVSDEMAVPEGNGSNCHSHAVHNVLDEIHLFSRPREMQQQQPLLSAAPSLARYELTMPMTPNLHAKHYFPFAPNAMLSSRQQRQFSGNFTHNEVPHRANATADTLAHDLQAPYLLLDPCGNVILGASVSFAARVGMTVKHLMNEKLDTVLRELQVENLDKVMEVVRAVASPLANSSTFVEGGDHSEKRGVRSRSVALCSFPLDRSSEVEMTVDVDGDEYSTVQSCLSPARMSESGARRILLRGKYLRPPSLPPPAAPATHVAITSSTDGQEVSLLDHRGSGLGDSLLQDHLIPPLWSFSFSLDVWMEHPSGDSGGNSFIILCQPRQHWILDWLPLPCFLVHPVTGEVLYWSRVAERQTGQLAYDMMGWPVHATPITGTSVPESNHQRGERPGGHPRWTWMESPLHAFLYIPSSLSSSPLTVVLQPLTGEFAEEESVALESGVVGLVWPPRNCEKAKSASLENCGSVGCAHEARGCCRREGSGACEHRQKSPSASSWYFSSLVGGKGRDVTAWATAGVPLLFVIHDEANSFFCPTTDHDVNKQRDLGQEEPLLHAVTDLVRVYREIVGDGSSKKIQWAESPSPSPVDGKVASHGTLGKLQQLDELVNRVTQVIAPFQTTSRAEAVVKMMERIERAGDVDPAAQATAGENTEMPVATGGLIPAALKTPSSFSLRLSPSVLLGNHQEEGDADHTPTMRSSGTSDGGGEGDEEEGCKQAESLANGGSGIRKVQTPLGDNGSVLSKKASLPRLISPMLMEGSAGTNADSGKVGPLDVAEKGWRTSGDASHPNHHVDQQQLLPDHPHPHQHHPQQQQQQQRQRVSSLLATPSMVDSGLPSDFATSPVMNSMSVEELPIWALLRSSDEVTVPSCFIRALPGEAFRFGRSSKCHATTSDTFVSSIQFTILRQPHSQSQLVQSNVHPYPVGRGGTPHGSHQGASSPSSPNGLQLPTGNWNVMLYDNSANGTYVNVKKVGKGKSCLLRDHDLITFRLSSSRFFLGFQFLLTDERGLPLREVVVDSPGLSRRGTPHHIHRNSSDIGSISMASGSQMSVFAHGNNNFNGAVGGGRRGGAATTTTTTRSRSSRPGGSASGGGVGVGGGSATAHQRETIEWKIGEEMLGKGGNAEVYLGINLTNGKLIAVKRVPLPTETAGSAESKDVLQQYRSLQEEINVLSKAVHTNIVQYYGSSQNQKYFNILLEFVPGGSLRHLLDNFGALSPGVICLYLRQTLEGLRYLHQHNIVHSDVKAANILITDKGRVKLSDFGTAKLLNKQHSQSVDRAGRSEVPNSSDAATYRVAGTLRWMAPELFRCSDNGSAAANTSVGPTKASDIWSVGCALIEMLSSEGPWYEYEFESEEQIINLLKYATEPPEVPECPELPELTAIAKRCLALSPESRPTCEVLLKLVEEASDRFQLKQEKSPSQPDVFLAPLSEAELFSAASSMAAASAALKNGDEVVPPRHQDPHGKLGVTIIKEKHRY